jgi:hypothetical protein
MKTTKNITLLGMAVLLSLGTSFAANPNSKNASTASQPTGTACAQAAAAVAGSASSNAAGNTACAAGSDQDAAKPAVALGLGKNGVSVNLNTGVTFGKSLFGKVFQNK